MSMSRCFRNDKDVQAPFDSKAVEDAITAAVKVIEAELARGEDISGGGVYVGRAGVGLMFRHLHLHGFLPAGYHHAESLQHRAHEVCLQAAHVMHSARRERITYLEGLPGPLVARLLIATDAEAGPPHETDAILQELQRLYKDVVATLAAGECELLYGRAGFLHALLLLRRALPKPPAWVQGACQELVRHIMDAGRSMGQAIPGGWPLMWAWHDKQYLGAAHGVVGILYTLLHCQEELEATFPEGSGLALVRATAEKLMRTCFASGNLPSSLGSTSDRLVQWCHGAPGLVVLLAECHAVFGDSSFLEAARRAADVVWERGLLTKGVGLCHGMAGNGYCFLSLYRATRDPQDLARARCFAEYAAQHWQELYSVPDAPASLYEGLAGCVCFWLDTLNPEVASMPGWELH